MKNSTQNLKKLSVQALLDEDQFESIMENEYSESKFTESIRKNRNRFKAFEREDKTKDKTPSVHQAKRDRFAP